MIWYTERTVCGRNLINCDLNESFVRERQVNIERTGGDSEGDNTGILSGGGVEVVKWVADLKEYNITARLMK